MKTDGTLTSSEKYILMAEQAKFCYNFPMNQHQEYMRWLHSKSTENPENQVVSRTFENSSGADELISLPQSYWGYIRWLEARGDIIFADWVMHCELNPHEDTPISHLLMYWLWLDECGRWMNCQPTPSKVVPSGFKFWKAEYGNRVWTAGCGRI